jgi:hypothetical protein
MIPRRRFHQTVFAAAGTYNMAFGVYSAFDPQWFFRAAGMETINHPAIFASLGMVVGLYGILYFEVARRPEHGRLIATVGLLGKTLGPLGMGHLILTGQWPASAGILIIGNDLIWWLPFALYLWDVSHAQRLQAPPR